MKLWGGRFSKETAKEVEEFSSSIDIDARMWTVDLRASIAHARMLGEQKIIKADEAELIVQGLLKIGEELSSGQWTFNPEAEDIHGEIEKRLFEKIGEPARKLHTARSRNDQVATDTRLFLLEQVEALTQEIHALQSEFLAQAEKHTETLLPGMTHFQHAQPVSLGHHLLAYFWMFQRDRERFLQSRSRISTMTLGSAALAGTGFPIDRQMTRKELRFEKVSENSLDAVSDRDFVIEFLSNASMTMMHLSRFCEELIIWSAPEFGFVELGDEVTTGSSIMPQKKNPDVAELVRGRVGRVYGALMGALTMMKGLPLAYNRDMQEDKVHLFSGIDTARSCVRLIHLTLAKADWKVERMQKSLRGDFSNATDLADDLVERGVSFREAHEVVGGIVQACLRRQKALEDLSLSDLKEFHVKFDDRTVAKLSHLAVLNARRSEGGTSPAAVRQQIELARKSL